MAPEELEFFKEIWIHCIVGKNSVDKTNELKEFLYKTLTSRNSEILDYLGIEIPKGNFEELQYKEGAAGEFFAKLAKNSSLIQPHPLGFFPKGILQTKKLTCAGNTLLTNTVLRDRGFQVKYARPARHSVNIVQLKNQTYWVDTTNNVVDQIDMVVEPKETFSIAKINTSNPKLHYRIVPIFEPEDIVVNIFGNMEALKSGKFQDSKVAEFLATNEGVMKVDFNKVKESLFQEYFDYERYDAEFQEEKKRIDKLLSDLEV